MLIKPFLYFSTKGFLCLSFQIVLSFFFILAFFGIQNICNRCWIWPLRYTTPEKILKDFSWIIILNLNALNPFFVNIKLNKDNLATILEIWFLDKNI